MTERKNSPDRDGATVVAPREKQETRRPRLFKVLLHNDDYTTMEFVVEVLMRHFQKSLGDATTIMLQVHKGGVGVAGVYPREIAETKAQATMADARSAGMPLEVTLQPE